MLLLPLRYTASHTVTKEIIAALEVLLALLPWIQNINVADTNLTKTEVDFCRALNITQRLHIPLRTSRSRWYPYQLAIVP